jgi:hypothetical protein
MFARVLAPIAYHRLEWAGTFLALVGSAAVAIGLLGRVSPGSAFGGEPLALLLVFGALALTGWALLLAGTIVRRRGGSRRAMPPSPPGGPSTEAADRSR